MIEAVRRINLLTVLVLLFAGLLQPFAAAEGATCVRVHGPAQSSWQLSGSAIGDLENTARANGAASLEHTHISTSQPEQAGTPSAPCGVAALPVERGDASPVVTARLLLPPGDPAPARLLIGSLFRPPRLS